MPQKVTKRLQSLKLREDGSTLQRIARIKEWLLGSYDPSDFAASQERDKIKFRIKKEEFLVTLIENVSMVKNLGCPTLSLAKPHLLLGWLEGDEIVQ